MVITTHKTDEQLIQMLNKHPWYAAPVLALAASNNPKAHYYKQAAPYLLAGASLNAINPPQNSQNSSLEDIDISIKSITPDSELISETLAQIYLAQGLTDKAIETYNQLSLKFPEKSAYFALQMQNISK